MSGHTPGPWEWRGMELRGGFHQGQIILADEPGNDADARLIAAAPALLAFVQIVGNCNSGEDMRMLHETVRAARALLARIAGEGAV